jgi:hypothetical protein
MRYLPGLLQSSPTSIARQGPAWPPRFNSAARRGQARAQVATFATAPRTAVSCRRAPPRALIGNPLPRDRTHRYPARLFARPHLPASRGHPPPYCRRPHRAPALGSPVVATRRDVPICRRCLRRRPKGLPSPCQGLRDSLGAVRRLPQSLARGCRSAPRGGHLTPRASFILRVKFATAGGSHDGSSADPLA